MLSSGKCPRTSNLWKATVQALSEGKLLGLTRTLGEFGSPGIQGKVRRSTVSPAPSVYQNSECWARKTSPRHTPSFRMDQSIQQFWITNLVHQLKGNEIDDDTELRRLENDLFDSCISGLLVLHLSGDELYEVMVQRAAKTESLESDGLD